MDRTGKIKAIALALFTRGSGMILQFATNLVLVRVLGASGMGVYSIYLAWMQLLSSVASIGLPAFVLRTAAVAWGRREPRRVRHLLLKAVLLIGATSAVVWALVFLASDFLALSFLNDIGLRFALIWAALAAFLFSLIKIAAEVLKSIERVNLALACETLLLPALVIALAGAYWLQGAVLAIDIWLMFHAGFLALVTVAMFALLLPMLRGRVSCGEDAEVKVLDRALLPMWGSALLGMWFLNMPVLLLPQFASTAEIGVFSMAYRLINITVNLLMVLAGIYGPRFARSFAAGDIAGLRSALAQTRWLSLALFMPVGALFLVFPEQVMSIFGDEFRSGGEWLVIMVLGQLVYSATGLVGLCLNMIHHEKEEFFIALGCSILTFLLIMVLGAQWGTSGVAAGFALGLASKNLVSLGFVSYHLNRMRLA